jgi:hypothetical protein
MLSSGMLAPELETLVMMTDLEAGRQRPDPGPAGRGGTDHRIGGALGWGAGAIAVVLIAWAVVRLLTALTVYTALTATGWHADFNAAGAAKINIEVTNSGTRAATGCVMHLRFRSGLVLLSSRALPVGADAARHLAISYNLADVPRTARAYLWLACADGSTARQLVTPPPDVSLVAADPAVTTGKTSVTVRFAVLNHGSAVARRCTASVRLTDGQTVAAGAQPAVRPQTGSAGPGREAQFTVSYPARAGQGVPQHVWAACFGANLSWLVLSSPAVISGG